MEHRPCGVWDAATKTRTPSACEAFHLQCCCGLLPQPQPSALPTASWAFVVQIAAGRIPLDATAPKPELAVEPST
jgi:hypothetical protein